MENLSKIRIAAFYDSFLKVEIYDFGPPEVVVDRDREKHRVFIHIPKHIPHQSRHL